MAKVKKISTENTKPLTTDKWDTYIESNLKEVITNTIKYYENYVFPECLEIIRYKQLDTTERALILYSIFWKDYRLRSNECYPLISQMHDIFTSNLYDTDTKARAVAFQEEDQDKSEMAQDFWDWAYWVANVFDEQETIRNEASLIGTAYSIATYCIDYSIVEYVRNGKAKIEATRDTKLPSLEHVNFFSMFLPPGTKDFYKSKYYIKRSIGHIDDYKNLYKDYTIDWSDRDELIKSAPISNNDYSRAYECRNYWSVWMDRIIKSPTATIEYSTTRMDEQIYYIDSKKNALVECIEYYEGNNYVLFINWKMKYNGISPLPGKPPFQCTIYEKQPGTYRGRGIWQKLLPLQKECNLIHNWVKDAITMGLYPMFLIPKGTMKNSKWVTPTTLYWEPGKVVEVTQNIGNAWIEPLKFSDIQYISLGKQQLEFILWQAQEIIGVNSYASGGQQKVERTSTGVNARVAVIRSRLQPIINSLNRLDRELFYQWMMQGTLFLDDEFKARIVGSDWAEVWKAISLSDILNRFDIIAENEANRLATKELRATQSLDAITKLESINVDPLTGFPIYDLEPAKAKVAENFNFPALEKISAETIKEKIKIKLQYQAIINPQPASLPTQGSAITQPNPSALPTVTQEIPGPANEALASWFAWDLYKEPNRLASQI